MRHGFPCTVHTIMTCVCESHRGAVFWWPHSPPGPWSPAACQSPGCEPGPSSPPGRSSGKLPWCTAVLSVLSHSKRFLCIQLEKLCKSQQWENWEVRKLHCGCVYRHTSSCYTPGVPSDFSVLLRATCKLWQFSYLAKSSGYACTLEHKSRITKTPVAVGLHLNQGVNHTWNCLYII